MRENNDIEAMNRVFAHLSEENKKKVLDMTKFLVLTQGSIIPAMLQAKLQKNKLIGG